MLVSYESIRQWCLKFGVVFADKLRRRRPRPGDKWHLDEVFIRIGGVLHYLWRAVDQDGVVLDILIQSRRDAGSAKRFFKRLLKGLQYVPRVLITDKLRSYGVAKRELLPGVEHRQSRYLNNRAENSHRPTRRRERQMQRFKSSPQARAFCRRMHSSMDTSTHDAIEWRPTATGHRVPRHSKFGNRRRVPKRWHNRIVVPRSWFKRDHDGLS